jgi:hypothetical protein
MINDLRDWIWRDLARGQNSDDEIMAARKHLSAADIRAAVERARAIRERQHSVAIKGEAVDGKKQKYEVSIYGLVRYDYLVEAHTAEEAKRLLIQYDPPLKTHSDQEWVGEWYSIEPHDPDCEECRKGKCVNPLTEAAVEERNSLRKEAGV